MGRIAIVGLMGMLVVAGCGEDNSQAGPADATVAPDLTPLARDSAVAVDGTMPDSAQPDLTQPDLTQPDEAQPDLAQPDLAQPDLLAPADLTGCVNSITIQGSVINGTKFNTASIPLQLSSSCATAMRIYAQGSFGSSSSYATSSTFSYSGADGMVTICVVFTDGNGMDWPPVCDTTTVDTTGPAAPLPACATASAANHDATLTWSPSSDGTGSGTVGYKVYYGPSSAYGGTAATEGASPIAASGTTQALSGLTYNGVSYHFAISAVDALGNEGPKSADLPDTAGIPWQWVFPWGGPGDAVKLQCTDASTCYVLSSQVPGDVTTSGVRGGLTKTSDGGATWTPLDLGAATQPQAMAFRDGTVGLVGLRENALYRRTSDGGRTWNVCSFAAQQNSPQRYIYGIRWIDPVNRPNDVLMFTSEEAGNGFSGVYYRSSDAGLTWTPTTVDGAGSNLNPGTFRFFSVQDPTVGKEVYAAGFMNLYGNTTPGDLREWTSQATGDYYDGVFRDPNTGIVGGANGSAPLLEYLNQGLWTQSNWSSCASSAAGAVRHVEYPAANAAYATASGTMCKSSDGGANWSLVPAGYTRMPTNTVAYSRVDGISFLDGSNGYVEVADNGVPSLYKTTNGGTTWTLLQTSYLHDRYDAANRSRAFTWVSENVGFVGDYGGSNSSSGYYSTTDGGRTWTLMAAGVMASNLPTGCNNPQYLHAYDATHVVALAYDRVCLSGDGGVTWAPAPTANLFMTSGQWTTVAVDWPSQSELYVIGQNGHVSSSTDGGTTWSQLPSITGSDNNSVAATTLSNGTKALFVGNSSGQLWRNLNSGSGWGSWAQVPAPGNIPGWSGVPYNRIVFPTRSTTGYLFSLQHNGTVLQTTNGGTSWTKVNVSTSGTQYPTSWVYDVSCYDDQHCSYIADSNIYVTNDGFATAKDVTGAQAGFIEFPGTIVALPGVELVTEGDGLHAAILKSTSRWQSP